MPGIRSDLLSASRPDRPRLAGIQAAHLDAAGRRDRVTWAGEGGEELAARHRAAGAGQPVLDVLCGGAGQKGQEDTVSSGDPAEPPIPASRISRAIGQPAPLGSAS
ncbi:hypothetical protein GCM10010168_13140 [Actinoplanes ianthinogenes]|uniref:Uncharacterized protein n=1 Tax=Actinoplanes ianthinogenes TaxID=122358 RepID=A0ABM7LYS8_9ACTN|nr:hypothetical protein Aiant_51580 [Actinoplanes ianthinogenes]GGQ98360.1 hypothetical protein GCM10010168_13140 [Actinoplanes ianthinogenes]